MDCITAARGAIVKAFGLPRSYNTSLEYIQLIISIPIKIKTLHCYYYLYPKNDQHLTSNNNINGIPCIQEMIIMKTRFYLQENRPKVIATNTHYFYIGCVMVQEDIKKLKS